MARARRNRHRLADLARRVRSGRLQVLIGEVFALNDAVSVFTHRGQGKTVIRAV